jgi:hypothetical protein
MEGVLQRYAVDAGYGDVEEFFAIVVTNTYISEKARDRATPLRRGPGPLLENLRSVQQNLWNALVNVGPSHALFNPVRDWEVERKKVLIDL